MAYKQKLSQKKFKKIYGAWVRFNTLPNTKIVQKIRRKRRKRKSLI